MYLGCKLYIKVLRVLSTRQRELELIFMGRGITCLKSSTAIRSRDQLSQVTRTNHVHGHTSRAFD